MKRPPPVTLVGDLSFRPDLASAVESSGCVVHRLSTLGEALVAPRGALFVVDGDDHIGSGLDRVRAFHGIPEGGHEPVLLLIRGSGVPEAARAYRDGVLDVVGADASVDALALRIRSLAALAVDVTRVRLLERNMADAQRMDAVGHLAGGVAHDFNNILSVITTLSDLLIRLRPADDPDREDLQEIFDAAQRGSEIARQLSAFSRPGQGQPEVLEIQSVVRRNEKMLRRLMGEQIELSFQLQEDTGSVRADPIHLDQIILNLALNARDALPDGGVVRIGTEGRTLSDPLETDTGVLAPGDYVVLAVTDSGTGIEESTRQRLFEPFFTTRGWGRHSGLGLSVVHGTVIGAAGGIEIDTGRPGSGTTFRVLLPVFEEDEEFASPASGDLPSGSVMVPTPRGETILLVEDHHVVRRGLCRALETAGYRVVEAPDGERAVELVRADGVRPHLVLTDVVMPTLGGVDLEREIRDLGLAVPFVYMSGYPDHPEVERLRRSGVPVLPKPIDLPALGRLLRRVSDEAAGI